MSQWPMVKLGDVCERKIPKWDRNGRKKYIDISTVSPETKKVASPQDVLGEDAPSRAQQIIRKNDVLVSTVRPNLNSVAKIPSTLDGHVASTGFCVLRATEKIDSGFLFHFVQTQAFIKQCINKSTGISYPSTTANKIKEILIPLPPLEEQRRIARMLSTARSAKQNYLEICHEINSIRDNYFLTIISNKSKILRSENLEDVADSVIDCPHSTPKWTESGIPCIWTNNLRKGYFNWDAPRFVSSETYKLRSARAYLQEGDIILSREGTVGVAAIIPRDFKGCMGQRLVQVRPSHFSVPGQWILASLLYLLDPVRISNFMVGATSKHLNVRDLRKLQIPIPTEQTLKQFIEFDKKSNELLKEAQKRSLLTQELYNSLATRAFAGQL
ncbi:MULTISPECIES: restriction endonuclease subunit S [Corynebacterium]|uniref:restriction endonuclease subunit S n=1 Tax=Corynebacterium TaxID=1716 RepID=UPI0009F62509|nr:MULTISPECIES: restriction endonuclease subunit S [Corynebacterium]MBC6761954.1 restriction endonuclease subunit S [Corynebacterium sp. LK27]MDK7110291.1 restriction endonuclease subunit S [Corynebacterium amycolatum]MDK7145228.1 restriction endonuclease subunit S [Corynebacterium amycolatum]